MLCCRSNNHRFIREALIHPANRQADVRVRRDDIGFNIAQMRMDAEQFFNPPVVLENVTNLYMDIWAPTGEGEGHFVSDQAKIDRETRNGAKIDGYQQVLDDLHKVIESCLSKTEEIHDQWCYQANGTTSRFLLRTGCIIIVLPKQQNFLAFCIRK
jgi:hypothetical protein